MLHPTSSHRAQRQPKGWRGRDCQILLQQVRDWVCWEKNDAIKQTAFAKKTKTEGGSCLCQSWPQKRRLFLWEGQWSQIKYLLLLLVIFLLCLMSLTTKSVSDSKFGWPGPQTKAPLWVVCSSQNWMFNRYTWHGRIISPEKLHFLLPFTAELCHLPLGERPLLSLL